MTSLRYTWRTFAREIVLIAAAAAFFIPLYLLVTISFKPNSEAYTKPLAFPGDPKPENYSNAWAQGGRLGLGNALLTSTIITIASVTALIVLGSLASYAIARRGGRLGTTLFLLFLLGIIVPFQLGIVPLYVVMYHLHLTGNLIGIIVLYTGLLMPLTVFLYTGFIRALPRDYEEAARVDGAGLLRTFVRVTLPLLSPVTGTVAILAGISIWNDFFVPLIFLSGSRNETLPVALYSFVGDESSDWPKIFAAVAISIAPMLVFYVVAQRHLIKGFSSGLRG